MAVANYESAHKILPPGSSMGMSLFVHLLPYLERNDLAQRVDHSRVGGADFLQDVSVPVYLCPSDGTPRLLQGGTRRIAGTNYAACCGSWANEPGFRYDGMFRTLEDLWPYDGGPIAAAQVTDGLSQTVAVGEILRSTGRSDRMRVPWELPRYYEGAEIDQFASACRAIPENAQAMGWLGDFYGRGTPWHDGGEFSSAFYNHVLTPNHPSCLNQNNVLSAASTTSSLHAKGVLTLFGDGHVAWTSNYVDVAVWRSFARRDDGQ